MLLIRESPMNDEPSEDSPGSQALYTNYFRVGYNLMEFVVDFGQLYSDSPEPRLHTRIVTGPHYAKLLSNLLHASIDQYEQAYGKIRDEHEDA
jgi:hypothetical protein